MEVKIIKMFIKKSNKTLVMHCAPEICGPVNAGGISGLCHRDNQYSQYTLNPKLWKTKFPMSGKFTNLSAMKASPFSVNSCRVCVPWHIWCCFIRFGF